MYFRNFSFIKNEKTVGILFIIVIFFCISHTKANSAKNNEYLLNQDLPESIKMVASATNIKTDFLDNAFKNQGICDSKNIETNIPLNLTGDSSCKEKTSSKSETNNGQKLPSEVNIPVTQQKLNSSDEGTQKKLSGSKKATDGECLEAGSESIELATRDNSCNSNLTDADNGLSDTTSNKTCGTDNLKQTFTKKLKKIKVNWFNTKLKAKDLGVNSQGDLYVVGVDGKLYKYEFITDSWSQMEGDFELTKINRVDVNWDGMPYVINEIGETFFLGCDHKWTRLPGCATDIGIGRGGEVFKTGCDRRNTGYGIYRLFCTCPTTCCYKGCMNWRKLSRFSWTHKSDERNCDWFRIEGNGIKIDVAPSGNPYTIDVSGSILSYDGTIWKKVLTPSLAFDLTLSNEGILFYTGQDGKIYKNINESNGTWSILTGEADAITAGPFSQPWIIRNSDKSVVGTSKFEYN